jgi:RNA polymerase sigma factor (sigma-70 family)
MAARDELVLRNRPFVLSVARHYSCGCTDDDLIQAGYLGLIHGAQVYDPDSHPGVRFLTIAGHYVLKEVREYLYSRQLVRQPAYLRSSSLPQPSTAAGQRKRAQILTCKQAAGRRVDYLGTTSWLSHSSIDPRDVNRRNEDVEYLNAALARLTTFQADVLTRRFGISGGAPQTARTIGAAHGLTKQRIYQVEKLAKMRLREAMCGE